jgi:amidase
MVSSRAKLIIAVSLLSGVWSQAVQAQARASIPASFDIMDATIEGIHAAMKSGSLSCVAVVQGYLARIKTYDQAGPKLNAIQNVNPAAVALAGELDAKLKSGGPLGRLHCIPVLVKDQVETNFMPTTYGSALFKTFVPARNATIVEKMLAEGAIILAKTNLGEFAAGGSGSAFGDCHNAYDPARHASGSSCGSGIAVTANFGAVGIGEDTAGSIRGPASHSNLVALKPTLQLVSRFGVMPQGPSRDTLGPITRTVRDNALLLDVLAGFDSKDPITAASDRHIPKSYADGLARDGLKTMRIGILRLSLSKDANPDAADFKEVRAILGRVAQEMAALGAEVIDPVEVPGLFDLMQASGSTPSTYETAAAIDAYLVGHPNAPVKTYREIAESPLVVESRRKALRDDIGKSPDDPTFLKQLLVRETLRTAIMKVMAEQRLDAFLYPSFDHEPPLLPKGAAGSNRLMASFTGFPALAIPGGFTAGGVPIGLELMGRPFDEATLYKAAYAYEQSASPRRLPPTAPPLPR